MFRIQEQSFQITIPFVVWPTRFWEHIIAKWSFVCLLVLFTDVVTHSNNPKPASENIHSSTKQVHEGEVDDEGGKGGDIEVDEGEGEEDDTFEIP